MDNVDITSPAVSLAAAMVAGKLSSVELVQDCLERIRSFDGVLGSFTEVFTDDALRTAAERDRERANGRVRGPLHGIPVAFKDLIDIAGRRTTVGSRLFDAYIAETTSSVVTCLQQSGMVTLGKTQLVELAFGGWGTNAVFGTPRNPWDSESHRIPGGSSSGSAVAVAAGLVPIGIGSDT